MLNVKELFESLSDKEKEELKKLLLSHTKEEEVSKEDTFANIAIIDPLQKNEEVTIGDQLDQIVNEAEAEAEAQTSEVKEPEEETELTVSEKQDFLVQFGYDPTNVKYMNTDILDQAYTNSIKIRDAEAGGEKVTGLPTEG